ncbi:MAG: ABC transporter substrate-binding protein [Burkholderiales bacterium]|nr:ABC transporter substrate-binding protein [Burkholderiales bacterium]
MTLRRRDVLAAAAAAALAPVVRAQNFPGVSGNEIRLGMTLPLTGAAAAYGAVGRAFEAYMAGLNDAGGINGRKIKVLLADDGYAPNRTLEQVRKLVERDQVLMIVGQTGTAPALATRKYLNEAKVPQLFAISGASTWSQDIEQYPWSLGWLPPYHIEGQMIAKHILATRPNAKVGVMYQNDDAGKGFLVGLKGGLATRPGQLVKEESFEASDPTVDSQVISLKSSGADVMVMFGVPKPTAQALRRAFDSDWKPQIYIGSVAISIPQVLEPAGLDKSKGVISTAYLKDPADPAWSNDKAMQDFRALMKARSPQTPLDNIAVVGASIAMATVQVLKQCGADLSRQNIIKQTMSLDMTLPLALPGLNVRTTPTQRDVFSAMRLQQFDGVRWNVMSA